MTNKYRVSLEVAKRMKELGYPQDMCDAYWLEYNDGYTELISRKDSHLGYAAQCVGRLGEDLPYLIDIEENKHAMEIGKYANGDYVYQYSNIVTDAPSIWIDATTEADARGLMWCELKERGLI